MMFDLIILSFFVQNVFFPPNHARIFKYNPSCLMVKATDSAGSDGETFGEVRSWHMGITHFHTYIS
jgi:hypothetical protein